MCLRESYHGSCFAECSTLLSVRQVAFIARNVKVARAARQKVLNRLVVDELGYAAIATGLRAEEAIARLAAAPELRSNCVAAARKAELDLYSRCGSTAVSCHSISQGRRHCSIAASYRGCTRFVVRNRWSPC